MSIEAKKRLDALRSSAESRLQWCAEGIAHSESQLSKLADAQAEYGAWLSAVMAGGSVSSNNRPDDLEPPFSEQKMLEISELIPLYYEQLNEYRDMATKTKEMFKQVEEAEISLANMDLEDRATVDYLFGCN